MERQLWMRIVEVIRQVDKPPFNPRHRFSVIVIVKVWMWSVIHDRPVSWSCDSRNWPPWARFTKPSETTMSRRLRSPEVLEFLKRVEARVCRSKANQTVLWMIDGKPLVISGSSGDRQAGYGRAAGGKAKGYKLHLILGLNGTIAGWRVAPMNADERRMAERMLKVVLIWGYVVGDANYDSNRIHAICDRRGNLQFVSPRRYGPDKGMGHRKQTAGRLRAVQILEDPFPGFGHELMLLRLRVERYFSQLTARAGGLTHLPPWVRTHRRVHRWVQAKLILNSLRTTLA